MIEQQTSEYKPHPLINPLRVGDVTWTWCSVQMDRTSHLWTGHKLICLECHPERKPAEE